MIKVCSGRALNPLNIENDYKCEKYHNCNLVVLYRAIQADKENNVGVYKDMKIRHVRADECFNKGFLSFEEIE